MEGTTWKLCLQRVARTVPPLRHVRFPAFGPSTIGAAHQVYSLLSTTIAVSLNLLRTQKTSERHLKDIFNHSLCQGQHIELFELLYMEQRFECVTWSSNAAPQPGSAAYNIKPPISKKRAAQMQDQRSTSALIDTNGR